MSQFKDLPKRFATAVVGISLLLLILIYGGLPAVRLFAGVLSLGMLVEFCGIVFQLPDKKPKTVVALGSAFILAFGVAFYGEMLVIPFLVSFFIILFSGYLVTARGYQGPTLLAHTQDLMFTVFGFIYLAVLPLFMPMIYSLEGFHGVMACLLMVWGSDIGGYFFGKRWGKHPLYTLISPKKTLEGALGGYLVGFLALTVYHHFFLNHWSWLMLLVTAFFVISASQIGDLCESLLKRAFDKKDSGHILPGHGGFLDRFDGLVFSLPVLYACIIWFTA